MAIEISGGLGLGKGGLEGIVDELEIELNEELRRIAHNLINNLAIQTPKLTGAATGEWQANINKRATARTYREDLAGSTVATEEGAVIDTAVNYKFPIIWISNLAPYIEKLNDGTSTQAPPKFIELALLQAEKAA
jgi:hypothetical protein